MDRPTCKTCPYWCFAVQSCRNSSPVVRLSADGSAVASWPPTAFDAWCGEHPGFPAWIESQKTPITPPPRIDPSPRMA